MLLFLLPFALLPVLLMGGAVYSLSYNYLKGQTTGQLTGLVENEAAQIASAVEKKQQFLSDLAGQANFGYPLDNLLTQGRGVETFADVRNQILAEYETARSIETEPSFDEIFVVTPEKTVLIASNPAWEGLKINSGPLESLLGKLQSIATYKGSPIYANRFSVFTAYPFRAEDGTVKATIFGVSNPSILRGNLSIGTLIHPDSKAYYLSQDGLFIGVESGKQELVSLQPSAEQQTRLLPMAQDRVNGSLQNLRSFDNELVLAYTKWIPEIQNQLVVEVPVDVINAPLRSLTLYSVPLILATLLFLGLMIWQGTSRLTAPLVQLSQTTDRFAHGDWQQRATVNRDDEIGRLAFSFNEMANQLTQIHASLEEKVEARTKQVRTASELAQMATSVTDLHELLRRTVILIVERFEYDDASVFLIEESGSYAVLSESWESAREQKPLREFQLPVGSLSMVGWVTKNNMLHYSNDIQHDDFYMPDELMPETQSEAVFPISVGDLVLGALDIQSSRTGAFQPEDLTTLMTVANQVAASLQNIRLLEAAKINLEETSLLYQASRKIAQSVSQIDIYSAISKAMEGTSLYTALLIREGEEVKITSVSTPDSANKVEKPIRLSVSASELRSLVPPDRVYSLIDAYRQAQLSGSLKELFVAWGCEQAALIPVRLDGDLSSMLILSNPEKGGLTPTSLQPFANLAEMASTALAKVAAQASMDARVNELQTLNQVSQSIAAQADLFALYQTIHEAINQVMGPVNFLIALYDQDKDQVHIPYMIEGDQVLSVDPFPLGEGLTSIVIRSKQPLLLADLNEEKLNELGAKIVGAPAKSWLGAPLIVAGEVTGVLVVQDLEQENRFSQADLRLFSTLSAQVAGSIRNAFLLETSRKQEERERFLYEVTSRIRNSIDRKSILETTAVELSRALRARRARIEIGLDGEEAQEQVATK